MKHILYISILFLLSCNAHKVVVKKVIDGDSFYLADHSEVRIYGLDCPEATRGHIQPFGIEATSFTRNLIEGKTVTIVIKDHDKYHRKVCKVILSDGNDLSQLIIKAGLAWTYSRYSPILYQNEELQAKSKRIGLWASNEPEPPFLYRKQSKQ